MNWKVVANSHQIHQTYDQNAPSYDRSVAIFSGAEVITEAAAYHR